MGAAQSFPLSHDASRGRIRVPFCFAPRPAAAPAALPRAFLRRSLGHMSSAGRILLDFPMAVCCISAIIRMYLARRERSFAGAAAGFLFRHPKKTAHAGVRSFGYAEGGSDAKKLPAAPPDGKRAHREKTEQIPADVLAFFRVCAIMAVGECAVPKFRARRPRVRRALAAESGGQPPARCIRRRSGV